VRLAPHRLPQAPSLLTWAALDAPVRSALRDYLAQERGTSARRRPGRLAALHALFHSAAVHMPSHSGLSQRGLAMPRQRDDRTPSACLPGAAIDALLAAPEPHPWAGRRDRTLRLVAVQTGRRVSEVTGLGWPDVSVGTGAQGRCPGTGRQTRCPPLRSDALTA
jgi:integrase